MFDKDKCPSKVQRHLHVRFRDAMRPQTPNTLHHLGIINLLQSKSAPNVTQFPSPNSCDKCYGSPGVCAAMSTTISYMNHGWEAARRPRQVGSRLVKTLCQSENSPSPCPHPHLRLNPDQSIFRLATALSRHSTQNCMRTSTSRSQCKGLHVQLRVRATGQESLGPRVLG